ncbi:hypothetical protein NQ318_003156 [Aromia moschata]|uniref:Uncharacterized protein n=1 Tax=Aromia moschata TaxID=1265417 RepID=A0AAV8YT28_9CUCU|nr:hypothetical protein NQ318_003156 [Aromia moschata]
MVTVLENTVLLINEVRYIEFSKIILSKSSITKINIVRRVKNLLCLIFIFKKYHIFYFVNSVAAIFVF